MVPCLCLSGRRRKRGGGSGHAHAQGVIHRDIKPSNLILDDDGRIRLTDFGIAKTLEDPTTVTTQDAIVGTISYLAPEIIDGEAASPASDIYSLAVTHEMLTGSPPYRADHIGTLLEAIRAGDAVPMEGVPAGMADTVRLAMSTDPADRPESAGAFAMGLVWHNVEASDETVTRGRAHSWRRGFDPLAIENRPLQGVLGWIRGRVKDPSALQDEV